MDKIEEQQLANDSHISEPTWLQVSEPIHTPDHNMMITNTITVNGSTDANDNFEEVFGSGHLPASDTRLTVHFIMHNCKDWLHKVK
ncbi:hypothetical protein FNH22_27665 [Fulvivirga sp. M361]|uniref:hypothetical protein n=1 Tax=Fulvivirga sp. M361 TaxID=2594266 RepID=UPI001179F364|nr:hypothetical protein [Fulvivirga sp. M361]TRX49015.1 hypothetical protein FNH22_27665 [Fulvivirga sp. M361]